MAKWEDIIMFYEDHVDFPREGEIWDRMRYHCKQVLPLIADIRMHPELSELEHFVSVVELRLINKTNGHDALIFAEYNEIARIIFDDIGGKNLTDFDEIRVPVDDVIRNLEAILLD